MGHILPWSLLRVLALIVVGSWVGSENLLALQHSVDTDATEPFAVLLLLLGS